MAVLAKIRKRSALLIGAIALALFAFITLGLLLEWAVRKVFALTSLKNIHSLRKQKVPLPKHTEPKSIHSLTPEVHTKI